MSKKTRKKSTSVYTNKKKSNYSEREIKEIQELKEDIKDLSGNDIPYYYHVEETAGKKRTGGIMLPGIFILAGLTIIVATTRSILVSEIDISSMLHYCALNLGGWLIMAFGVEDLFSNPPQRKKQKKNTEIPAKSAG